MNKLVPLVMLMFLASCDGKKDRKPNILLIMADDMGYADAECYGGNIKTPNINLLAKEGIRFTDFYSAAPNCSPARTGLLTGRTPSRVGVYDYLAPDSPMHLPRMELTLAELLRRNGYATCHVGKWHLSTWTRYQMLGPKPDEHGFDYWFAVDNNAYPSHRNPVNYERNGEMVGELQGYACDLVVEEAMTWLDKVYTPEKPFFLNVWFNEPHAKIASPPDLLKAYEAFGQDAAYMANIANMDRAMGRLLDRLEEKGMDKETFVLFTSDNGPYRQKSTGPFRGKKSYLFEGGIRVPGIIRWPEKVLPGQETGTPAGLIDLFPTVSEIAGIPMLTDRAFDGESIYPLLVGKDFERSLPLYWFFYKRYPIAALRSGDYVILGNPEDVYVSPSHPFDSLDLVFFKNAELQRFEVYDLKNDPGQQHDLYEEDPSYHQHLKAELLKYHEDVVSEGPVWAGLPLK